MNVYEVLRDRYPNLAASAQNLGSEREGLIDWYQSEWDKGTEWCFKNPMDMFSQEKSKRSEDSKEEIDACINDFASTLRRKLFDNWLKKYNREQILSMLNMLGDMDANGSLSMWGRTIQYCTIADSWNFAHPDEAPIRLNTGVSF